MLPYPTAPISRVVNLIPEDDPGLPSLSSEEARRLLFADDPAGVLVVQHVAQERLAEGAGTPGHQDRGSLEDGHHRSLYLRLRGFCHREEVSLAGPSTTATRPCRRMMSRPCNETWPVPEAGSPS